MARVKTNILRCICACFSSMSIGADFSGTIWEQAAIANNLDPAMVYAVAINESGFPAEVGIAPHSYTVRYDGKVVRAKSWEEYVDAAYSATASYEPWQIDIGAMQLNLKWMSEHGDISDMLDPQNNILIGAKNLAKTIASAPDDLELGVGRYFSWVDEQGARQYGRKALEIYRQIKNH